MYYLCMYVTVEEYVSQFRNAAAYDEERFVLQETFLKLRIGGL